MSPSNSIHESAVVGSNVRLGSGNVIGPGVVIAGPVDIGDDNWFGAHVVIGCPPEVRGFPHRADWIEADDVLGVRIGNRNVIREGSQIHCGWHERTTLGDDLFLMNKSYVAHDCRLADGVTLAANVALGGHVHVGERANLGLGTVVHQRRQIGSLAMIGMGSVVARDLPSFVKAYGNPCRVKGVNTVGMERAGIGPDVIAAVVAGVAAGDHTSWQRLPDLHPFAADDGQR